jgi:hypothetical protein
LACAITAIMVLFIGRGKIGTRAAVA